MCGIAGIVNRTEPADKALLSEMSRRLAHRGPDDRGELIEGTVGFAHRRLSIIDLSDAAKQPLSNEDGRYWLIYNGEIYNYLELREELTALGHQFSTASDSEVIIHAFEEWGDECTSHFNGMWAFAIYDRELEEVFCSRDRFGIKPFYYAHTDDGVIFASEIKALCAHPDIGTGPDEEVLMAYLRMGLLDYSEKTLFKGVYQLPPAHSMRIKNGNQNPPQRYWRLDENAALYGDKPLSEQAEKLRSLLHDSVRLRLRSDVPVGTCLSGGIDSSSIAALINILISEESPESTGERQKTFTALYKDPKYSEGDFFNLIKDHLGVESYTTTPAPVQILNELSHLVSVQDGPFVSLSVYAQYRVMECASHHVKVILDGQGADEQLAGYDGYLIPFLRSCLQSPPSAITESVFIILFHLSGILDGIVQIRRRKSRRYLFTRPGPAIDRYSGRLDQVLKREIESTNLPSLLHYEDRNSMAFSIESRVPFLDYRLAEYISSLPLTRKMRHGITKYILREAVRGLIPEGIRRRKDKMGFVTPEEEWLKSYFRSAIENVIHSEKFSSRPYWDAEGVRSEFASFFSGKKGHSPELWRIFCAEIWLRVAFDDGEGASSLS